MWRRRGHLNPSFDFARSANAHRRRQLKISWYARTPSRHNNEVQTDAATTAHRPTTSPETRLERPDSRRHEERAR